jgi:hypothetical protein
MTKNLKKADKVYHELLTHTLLLLEQDYPYEMVAAALMAIAQRLYKTHLSEEDYKRIMKTAFETYVEPYDLTKGSIH